MSVENALSAMECARCGVVGNCLPFVDESHHHDHHDGYHGNDDLQPVCHWNVDPHRTQAAKPADGDDHERRWDDSGCDEFLDVALVRYLGGDSNVQWRGPHDRAGRDAFHRRVSDHHPGLRHRGGADHDDLYRHAPE